MRARWPAWWCAVWVVAVWPRIGVAQTDAPAAESPAAEEAPVRSVAVTIDDLPLADLPTYPDRAAQGEAVARLCGTLQRYGVPVTGFFNLTHHAERPELLEAWIACGIRLGNHTWSHSRLPEVGLDAYLADLQRGHDALLPYVAAGQAIPFRYPYLFEGLVPAERDAIRARLAELGSPAAPVTIDTSDWLYSRGYSQALRAGDVEAAERYRQAWLWNIQEATERAEWLADQLFGREVPQVLLLHGNEINADHLAEALDWLQARGYQFVSLEEVLADEAYREEDRSVSPTGDSHWLRLRRSRTVSAP